MGCCHTKLVNVLVPAMFAVYCDSYFFRHIIRRVNRFVVHGVLIADFSFGTFVTTMVLRLCETPSPVYSCC